MLIIHHFGSFHVRIYCFGQTVNDSSCEVDLKTTENVTNSESKPFFSLKNLNLYFVSSNMTGATIYEEPLHSPVFLYSQIPCICQHTWSIKLILIQGQRSPSALRSKIKSSQRPVMYLTNGGLVFSMKFGHMYRCFSHYNN